MTSDWPSLYRARRHALHTRVPGAILFLGDHDTPRNYPHNVYPFRQNSSFLYYGGHNLTNLALLIMPDGTTTLFLPVPTLHDTIWSGPPTPSVELAAAIGANGTADITTLSAKLHALDDAHVPLHYLAPYRADTLERLADLLDLVPEGIRARASVPLLEAIIDQRSRKGPEEISEIEEALGVTNQMHRLAMSLCCPGQTEAAIAGAVQGLALAHERQQAYGPIVTVRGEVFHAAGFPNTLSSGQLLLNDSGAESPKGYASDITRTLPVSGHYNEPQRALYELVLAAQLAVIEGVRPGVPYRDLHLRAATTIAAGLIDLGLMEGTPEAAVESGAIGCFFPHGVGHMLGLDVHDMEDLGEDRVGYAPGQTRSDQLGLKYLRLARPLEEGFVLTVEPGLYFIPSLMDLWESEGKHREFIRYDRLKPFRDFGGIRIEDDVLVTKEGARVLGPGIPKTVAEVEAAMGVEV